MVTWYLLANSNRNFPSEMGGSLATVRNILQSPLTEEQLRSCLGHVQEAKVQQWCKILLSGATPTNFSFEDMCAYLNRLSGDDFIVLPVWTLNLPNVQSTAMCILKHWSHSVPDANLRNMRVMLPLFKEGDPIGHARFLFFDVWQPMPEEILLQERNDCMDFLQEIIPEEGICRLILFEYEGLCPTRHQTESGTIKIIDSMPGNMCRRLQMKPHRLRMSCVSYKIHHGSRERQRRTTNHSDRVYHLIRPILGLLLFLLIF